MSCADLEAIAKNSRILVVAAVLCWVAALGCNTPVGHTGRPLILDSTSVATLLVKPNCLATYAAYVFYKRGTGPSGGIYADATYDDFIDDVVNIAEALAEHPNIDPARIGVQGGSSGAYVAAVAAARSSRIAFVISNSGPLCSWEEETNYNRAGTPCSLQLVRRTSLTPVPAPVSVIRRWRPGYWNATTSRVQDCGQHGGQRQDA
jgi:pimeloyl-ACP methyl ester carboxylesterase